MSIKKALLVGIDYLGTNNQLDGCINDVINVQQVLITKYGYSSANILMLTDNTKYKPTKANIIAGFYWLLSDQKVTDFDPSVLVAQTQAGSHNYFHYSGHGTNVSEDATTHDAICPLDFPTYGMLSADEVSRHLTHRVPATSSLNATIDACHSANYFELDWTCVPYPLNFGYTLKQVSNFPPTTGPVTMLSGCQDNQTSADLVVANQDQGALTYCLLQVLKQNNYNITFEQLLIQVRSTISNLLRAGGQIPALTFGIKIPLSNSYSL